MKLFVTTAPFLSHHDGREPVFFPVGTTFVMVGFSSYGIYMQATASVNKGEEFDFNLPAINPELLKHCFKEVEPLKQKD